jgi:hypothetical protein
MRNRPSTFLCGLLLLAWAAGPCPTEAQVRTLKPTIAFYYGFEVPREIAQAYDQIVVQPAHVKPSSLAGHSEAIAYVSLGEVAGDDRRGVQQSWVLGTNPHWDSAILDIRNEDFQKHLLESRILPLAREGYAGVFLDTLDSPLIYLKSESERKEYREAIVAIISAIRARAPNFTLIVNRGFEVLDDIASQVDAVAAESLFGTWNGAEQQYRETTASDQEWLLQRLDHAQRDLGLRVIIVDYADPERREDSDRLRRRIASRGFTPWVADWQLTTAGFGEVDLIPRRVMVLRDGLTDFGEGDQAFRALSPVLEQMGFVAVFEDLASTTVPKLDGLYAGLIVWAMGGRELPTATKAFVRKQLEAGVPVLLLGDVPALTSAEASELFRLHAEGTFLKPPVVLRAGSAELGFEVDPIAPALPIQDFRAHSKHEIWLSVRGRNGGKADVVAVTDWGGYALSSYFLRDIGLGEQRWVVDPFVFLRASLRLPTIPVPALDTEDGERILIAEIHDDTAKPVPAALQDKLSGLGFRHELIVDDPAAAAKRTRSKGEKKLFYPVTQTPLQPGRTDATLNVSSWTHVSAAGRMTDDGVLQAYFPMASATAYGVESSPYAYRRLTETFDLTGRPCRVSALGIRFDTTLASSPGGLRALDAVYGWLSEHAVRAQRSEEYAERVRDFYALSMVRRLDGRLQMRGAKRLRSYRLPSALGQFLAKDSSELESLTESALGQYASFGRPQDLVLAFEPQTAKSEQFAEPAAVDKEDSLTKAALCR